MNEQLKYQIAIQLLPDIGLKHAKQLIEHFGGAAEFFSADLKQLTEVMSATFANNIQNGKKNALERANKEVVFIVQHNIQTYYYNDSTYPFRLRQCPDCPLLLYAKGNIEPNQGHFVSIVGTRMPTQQGKDLCHKLVVELAQRLEHVTIVSGLAYGIDVTAHRAAIETGIPTLIIPGHGLDRIYPFVHRQVATESLRNGGIITEFPSGTQPDRFNFIARNRIIAGLSDVTVVVESKQKGGSLTTANMAYSYSRDVMAFPGRVSDEVSAGCNTLIRERKAELITSADDLIMAMQWDANRPKQEVQTSLFQELTPEQEQIVRLLKTEEEGMHINYIVLERKRPYSQIADLLMQLEFMGLVRSLPGGIYRTVN